MLNTECTICEPDRCSPCCLGAYSLVHIYKFLSLKLPLGLVYYLVHNMHKNKNIAIFYMYTGCVFSLVTYISSVQLLSHVRLFATPWIAACQASLSITNSWSLFKLTSIESVMPSRHLILCHSLLLLPPIPASIRVFSSESALHMRWPKYWNFSFSISPSKERQDWSPLGWTGWTSLQSKGLLSLL